MRSLYSDNPLKRLLDKLNAMDPFWPVKLVVLSLALLTAFLLQA